MSALTYDEAVDIMYGIQLPKNPQNIVIETDEGKMPVKAEVRGKLALFCYNRQWHLIHTVTDFILLRSRKYEDCEELMNAILHENIDLIFTRRDFRVCTSILKMMNLRKKQMAKLQVEAV